MNVHEWLFSNKEDLKKAVETMRTLFYSQKEDGEWENITLGYELTISELQRKTPGKKYQYASLRIRPESLDEKVYFEVYATETKDEGERSFGIDFIPWADVLGMSVEVFLNHDIPKHELIAHFLLELTFDGFTEEEMEEGYKELIERVSKVEKADVLHSSED